MLTYASGGGAGGAGAGDVVGPASSTDNAIARFDSTTGKLLQDSAVSVSDVAAASVTVGTVPGASPGVALVVEVTEPAAAAGASVAGKGLTLNAGDAVASTDTAGAAAGGAVTIQAGAAARLTSGNANGGSINLIPGAGIGTGVQGQVLGPIGAAATPGFSFTSDPDTGMFREGTDGVALSSGGNRLFNVTPSGISCTGNTLLATKRQVLPEVTSPETISNTDSRKCITNEGAAGAVTYNLPTATVGQEYIFVVQSTNNMVVTAAAGDTIRVAAGVSSAGGTATNGTIGSTLHILSINATEWVALGAPNGTWTLA